jgi:hypothetical protein
MNTTLDHPAVQNALNLYCQWLNSWSEHYKEDWSLTTENFQEYSKVLSHVPYDGLSDFFLVAADYGDDGGPAILAVWAVNEAPHEIHYMVQEFDTYIQPIYDNSNANDDPAKFLNIPKEA